MKKLKPRNICQKSLGLVLIGLLTFGSALILAQPIKMKAIAASVPASVSACFPKVPIVKKAELFSQVQEKGITYYLMSSDQSEGDSDLLISVNNKDNRCSLLLFNPMGDVIPLSRFVPVSVARQFALEQIKTGVKEAGSREAYQQKIMQVEVWTPEEIWAVRQLGFRPPQKIQLISPEDIKVSPES